MVIGTVSKNAKMQNFVRTAAKTMLLEMRRLCHFRTVSPDKVTELAEVCWGHHTRNSIAEHLYK